MVREELNKWLLLYKHAIFEAGVFADNLEPEQEVEYKRNQERIMKLEHEWRELLGKVGDLENAI